MSIASADEVVRVSIEAVKELNLNTEDLMEVIRAHSDALVDLYRVQRDKPSFKPAEIAMAVYVCRETRKGLQALLGPLTALKGGVE